MIEDKARHPRHEEMTFIKYRDAPKLDLLRIFFRAASTAFEVRRLRFERARFCAICNAGNAIGWTAAMPDVWSRLDGVKAKWILSVASAAALCRGARWLRR